MKVFRFTLLLAAVFMMALSASAQTTITGIVKDAKTGETLPGVNVYLANTTIGDATNGRGSYKITTSETGTYELVFSFIGYKKKVQQVNVVPNKDITVNATLQPDPYEMEEIKVSDSNQQWQRRFQRFRREFIGQTDFAQQTEIENPFIIDFSENEKGNLVASAPQALEITNRALGYRLYVELDAFNWTNNMGGYYKIYPKYELMEPKGQDQQEEWVENRRETYENSLQHFLMSLYHEKLNDNQFTIENPSKLIQLSEAETKFEVMSRPNVPEALASTVKGYKLTGELRVIYGQTQNVVGPRGGNFTFQSERSELVPNTKKQTFFVDNKGNLLNPISLMVRGYWSRYRLADQLPSNYAPDE